MPYFNQSEMYSSIYSYKLHPNEYSQEFYYSPFADRCAGSCNTINDLSNKVNFPNRTEDLNLSVFNMITAIKWITNINKAHIMRV